MMFASAFASVFAGRSVAVEGGFSSAFAANFAGVGGQVAAGYIGPMRAQAALADGAGWVLSGHSMLIGGKLLIGPAGKVFFFAGAETAHRWAENARGAGLREVEIIAGLAADRSAAWKARKREKLAVIAARVADAAARQHDDAKRAALVLESSYCLSKWG